MGSRCEDFWLHDGFVVIGNSDRAPFPKLTFAALKAKGKRVYAVDPSRDTIEGEHAYDDLSSVPGLPLAAGVAGSGGAEEGKPHEEPSDGGCEGEGSPCCCGDAAPAASKRLAAAAVLEAPQDETFDWIEKIADSGIKAVWIHMGRETPESLELAKEKGLDVFHGTCAVQYIDQSFPHSVHAFIRKLLGRW